MYTFVLQARSRKFAVFPCMSNDFRESVSLLDDVTRFPQVNSDHACACRSPPPAHRGPSKVWRTLQKANANATSSCLHGIPRGKVSCTEVERLRHVHPNQTFFNHEFRVERKLHSSWQATGQSGQSLSTLVLQARQVLKIFHRRSDKATT